MELEPKTEKGRRLCQVLQSWLTKSPESVLDLIKRAVLMYSTKTVNEDSFLVSLYCILWSNHIGHDTTAVHCTVSGKIFMTKYHEGIK